MKCPFLVVVLLCNVLYTATQHKPDERLLGFQMKKARGTATGLVANYKIELFIVVDYSFYKHWFDKTNGTDILSRQKSAQTAIEKYIGSLIYTANHAYTDLLSHGLHLEIVPVAVLITTTAAQSSWTEHVKVTASSNITVEPTAVLELFKTMSIRAKIALAHDHAMLFTKYQIQTQKSESKVGYANVAAMCTDRSVSLIEDSMYIYTANTIAHELSHSLGANHDGDGNMCSALEGFIMAPDRTATRDEQHNEWLFSSCTVDYIKHYMNQLDGKNSNCLRIDNNPRPFPQDIEYSKHMYGSIYGADEQCQMKYGPHSYVCRSFYNVTYTKLCSHMNCFDPKDLLCHDLDAGEGTPCGDQKWCILGTCVQDQNARRTLGSCPLGDQPGVVQQGLTCSELISRSPQKCYVDYIHTICCGSCSRTTGALIGLNKTVDEQCREENGQGSYFCRGADIYKDRPYGDIICTNILCADPHRDKWCIGTIPADGTPCGYMKQCAVVSNSTNSGFGPQISKHVALCQGHVCKQQICVHYDSAPPVPDTCLYGDSPGIVKDGLDCKSLIKAKPHSCYDSWTNHMCCASCATVYTGITGCEYGDKSEWCGANFQHPTDNYLCYQGTKTVNNSDLCCKTCAQYKNSTRPDCLYGDRSDWCSSHIQSVRNAYLCYTNEHLCCGTCGRYTGNHKEDASCHYGDKSDWCAVNIPSLANKRMCYYGDNANLCCGTCKAYKGNITGCEFGDRQNGCVRSQCSSYSQNTRNSLCCETCSISIPNIFG